MMTRKISFFKIWIVSLLLGCLFFRPFVSLAENTPSVSEDEELLSESVPSQDSKKDLILNVDDCIQMALLNNKEIRAADYDIEAAKWKHSEAKAGGVPVFEYNIDMGPAPTNADDILASFASGDITMATRFKVEMGVPVFSFGKLHLAQSLAKEGIVAEEEKKLKKENEIVVKVQKLYSGVLLARGLIKILKEAESHLTSEIVRKEQADEPADPLALTKLRLFRFEITKKLGEAETKLDLAIEGLRITLGISQNYNFELADKHLSPVKFEFDHFEKMMAQSRKKNPDEKLLHIGVRAKEKLYRLEKLKLTPDIGVGGFFEVGFSAKDIQGLDADDDFNNPFNFTRAAFGVRLKGKLDIKGQRARIKRTQAEYYSAALKKNIAKEGLALEFQKHFKQVKQAWNEWQDSDKGLKLARQMLFLTKSNLDIGVGDADEYANALKQYLIMRGRYLESVFNYNSEVAELRARFENASEIYQMR